MGNKQGRAHNLCPTTLQELQNNVNVDFTSEEIKEWYNEFQNSCKSSKKRLTLKEFKEVYNSLFTGDATEFAKQVFRTFDLDRNGTVDFKEFVVGLCMSGSSDYEKKMKWAFSMYDIDGDGYIDKEEMRHIFHAIFQMTKAVLPEEINSPEKMTEKIFEEFDLDNDEKISMQEFEKCAIRNSLVLDVLQCDPDERVHVS